MPTGQTKDYYKALGVKRSASKDDIRKAYRRLARKYHPDVNPGDKAAEDRFKDIQEAYGILSDEKKKQMYDQYGFYSPHGFADAGSSGGSRPGDFGFSGFDFSEFARGAQGDRTRPGAGPDPGWQGGFGDLFSQFFKSGDRGQQPQPKPGEDLEYTVDIDFWEAIRGVTRRLTVNRYESCAQCGGSGSAGAGSVTCPECQGKGQVTQTVGAMRFSLTCPRCNGSGQARNVCPTCNGDGRTSRPDTVEVRIPAGAQDGSRLRVPRKGNAGAMGAAPGDLYIITRVGKHQFFQRQGDDIRVKAPISIPEAVLGAKIEVPTIEGRAILKIPPATSSGKIFRLRERGVLNPKTQKRGDQFVEVQIITPAIPDENTKELMREFSRLNSDDPRQALFEQV